MSHEHNHTTANIGLAFFLNLVFALFELGGSFFTNSLSLFSNGLHDLGDSVSLAISFALNKLANKSGSQNYTYGYRRLSLVAAFINSLVLIGGAVVVFTEAIPRLMHPEHSNADGMFIFAVIGLGINLTAYLRLKKGQTMSENVAALHLLDDVLGLGSVLVISIIIKFYDLHILDPLLSIIITCYVLWNVIKNFKKIIRLFLQAVPENMDVKKIEDEMATVTGVIGVHDTHLWSLDGEHNVLSTHLVVKDNTTHDEMVQIKNKAKLLISKGNIQHSTIEIECENENCDVEN